MKQEPSLFSWHSEKLSEKNKQVLSTEQALIVSVIGQSLERFSCHLIDGVTGSGKTEVYLQAMENVLAKNQQVLVIVPEIGLTPHKHYYGLNNVLVYLFVYTIQTLMILSV